MLIAAPLKYVQWSGEISSGGCATLPFRSQSSTKVVRAKRRGWAGGHRDKRSIPEVTLPAHGPPLNKQTNNAIMPICIWETLCCEASPLSLLPHSPSISDSKQPASCLLACVYARVCSHWELLRSLLLLLEPSDYACRLFIYLFIHSGFFLFFSFFWRGGGEKEEGKKRLPEY